MFLFAAVQGVDPLPALQRTILRGNSSTRTSRGFSSRLRRLSAEPKNVIISKPSVANLEVLVVNDDEALSNAFAVAARVHSLAVFFVPYDKAASAAKVSS
jgi:hypothetical protein